MTLAYRGSNQDDNPTINTKVRDDSILLLEIKVSAGRGVRLQTL